MAGAPRGAQSVTRLTLDFSSGHDLTVPEIEPHIRLYADSIEPGWDSLSLSKVNLKRGYYMNRFIKKVYLFILGKRKGECA